MASAIEDVTKLPGETLHDQDGGTIGEIKQVYGVGDEREAMWVTVEASTGLGRSRLMFVPVARIKHEYEEIRVPYSAQHVHGSPEVEGEELSDEDDLALRNYYAIGLGDQELRTDNNDSYAARVPEDGGEARPIEGEG